MDHDSSSHAPPPPPPPPDDGKGDEVVVLSYFFIFYFFIPLCILFALIYYSLRNHLWELCCYYDVESALEPRPPQQQHQPNRNPGCSSSSTTTRPFSRIIKFLHFFTGQNHPHNLNPNSSPQHYHHQLPPMMGRLTRDSLALMSPGRLNEIAESFTECAICKGSLLDEESGNDGEGCTTLPLCGHRFHKVCVYHWLNRKATCPICRRFYPFPVRPKLKIFLNRK